MSLTKVPSSMTDSTVVNTQDDQTISGQKTFTTRIFSDSTLYGGGGFSIRKSGVQVGGITGSGNWKGTDETDTGIYAETGKALRFFTNGSATEQAIIDTSGNLQFNSGYGSVATAYGCRAWVNFNGTGTVAIRASGNVSSITDNGTGDYTVNFTNAMPDATYSFSQAAGGSAGMDWLKLKDGVAPTTSALRVTAVQTGVGLIDVTYAFVAIFR